MKITICGSMAFLEKYEKTKKHLELKGHEIIIPEKDPMPEPVPKERKLKTMIDFNENLFKSDGILVMNYTKKDKENHIGVNTLMEIGMAFNRKKQIFILNPIPEQYKHELEAINCIVINKDLEKIQ